MANTTQLITPQQRVMTILHEKHGVIFSFDSEWTHDLTTYVDVISNRGMTPMLVAAVSEEMQSIGFRLDRILPNTEHSVLWRMAIATKKLKELEN